MKIKVKKAVEAPNNVKEVVQQISSTPLQDIASVLRGFKWTFDKGDINHWVPVLDHFDSFLEEYVSSRADLQLKLGEERAAEESAFPSDSVLAVLTTTCSILENCGNKGAYNSTEHLSNLLAAPAMEVTAAALQVFQVLMRKTHHTSVRLAVSTGLTQRLLSLCKGWGGKEESLELAVCASRDESALQKVLHKATTLHFEFTPEKSSGHLASAAGTDPDVQPVTLHVPGVDRFSESEHVILAELVRRYKVPPAARFDLLCRIRIARNFGSLTGRRQLVHQRLLAFNVLLQCSPSADEYTSLYLAEPEIVSELVGLVQAEEAVEEEDLRTLALKALAAQLQDRSRSSSVITAVTSGGQSGLLAMLLHKSVASILQQANVPLAPSGSGVLPSHVVPAVQEGAANMSSSAASPVEAAAAAAPAHGSVQYSVSFVDALLTLVAGLVTSSSGCQALNDAGVISALLPLLRDHHPDHLNLVCTSLKILEMYMDLNQTAATTFRDLGGLTEVIKRLAYEVGAVMGAPAEATAAIPAVADSDVVMASLEQQAGLASRGAADQQAAAAETSTLKQLPHNRKSLLKILLRIITISSYQPTGNLSATRPVDDDAQLLYASLKAIYGRAEEFGGTLFSHAVQVMTDLIHHEPQSFRQLQEAGLPDAFLTAVKAGVFPSGECICAFPGALVALCLNSGGLKQVRETAALNVLGDIFTSKKAMRVLTGDTPSVLGSGLEELMRFVPSLRSDGVNVVLGVFKALCILGGDEEAAADAMKPLPPEPPAATATQPTAAQLTAGAAASGAAVAAAAGAPAPAAAQPMDTDAATSSAVVASEQAGEQPDVGTAAQAEATQLVTGAEAAAEGMDVDVQPEAPAAASTGQQPGAEAGVAPPAVAAAGPAPAANAQQERELERQRQQAEDDRLAAIAKRVLAHSLQKVADKKDQQTDVEAFLPLALTAASRMLEPLLANAETSRLFVERGGADLLLKLYKLPRLTTVFNFSSASHSLLSVFRALSGAHGTAIAAKSKDAVAQQVAVLLPMAEQVGPVCVPTLPADLRDKYSKQVLVVQGLVALTSAVARNVSAMLPQVSMGDPPLLASMGKLERVVLAQAAASDPWKQARDAAKKAAAAAEATAAAPGGGNSAAEAAHDGSAGAGGSEAVDATDHDAAGDEDMEGPAAEQPADRAATEAAPGAAAAAAGSNNGKQKRTPEDTAYDALSYLLTSMRTFYMGTAKAIHTPVRRREETATAPTAPMKAAALSLALLLVGNLQLRPWQQQQAGQGTAGSPEAELSAAEAERSSSVAQLLGSAVAAVRGRSGHFLRVVEEVNQVLFDSRRHYCHLLVLNYFSALGGMQVYASTFREAADLLWNLLDLQGAAQASQSQRAASSGDQSMTDVQIGSNTSSSDITAAAMAGPGTAGTKDPKQITEAVLVKMLAIYEQLANATVLLSAPQATQMLLAALPNYAGQPLVAPAKDALHFVQHLHSHILAAVLPLWSHPKVACAPPGVLTAIIRVLQTCSQGPGPASMILRYSQRPAAARAPPQPDAGMVQQIIEMGFSQSRAEEALRRVGANSVELAMEWLITHPEEPAAAAGAQAGGAAATGASAADAAVTEEEELTRALLASLSVVGMSPDVVAQRSQQQQVQQQQNETEAAARAGPAEGSTAAASDQEAVTPQSTSRPVIQPGAPVLGAAAAAAAVVGSAVQPSGADTAGIPAPAQLIDGAIRLIAASPATAFSIADLVSTIVQREDGKDREAILERLMNDCLPPAADTASSSAAAAVPADADVSTPARLLLLLLHKDAVSRKVAARKGLVARCLQAFEGWQAQYTAVVQQFERLPTQQQQDASETRKLEIPVWVEAVLMLLELMTTTQVKSSTPAAATRTAQDAARATTAAAAAARATGPAAEGGAAPAAAAGEGTPEAARAQPAADPAADGDVQMVQQPEAAATPAAAAAPVAQPAIQEGAAHPPELQLAGMTEALANWKPCGLVDDQQQQRATSVAVALLQQLHSHADHWDRPDTSMYEADGSVPNPGSVTTVVLQLLNHLTKRYSNAQQVLAGNVHQLLLSLPVACLAPSINRQEGLISGILRHMLEDPITLESWMESEIKNSMSVKARDPYYSARPYYNRRNPMSRYTTAASFLTMMSSLVGRDPAVFLQAVARTCALETSGGETMVRLRTGREQQQHQSAAPSTAASRDASAAGAPPASEAAAPAGAVAAGPPATPPAGSRSAVATESTAAAVPAQENTMAGAADRIMSKSSLKSTRKLVPASFVEVVDALLDVVLTYQGVKPTAESARQQRLQGRPSDTAAMDVDAAATMADQQAPAAPATASDALAKPAAAVSLDVTPLPTDLLLRKLNPVAREAGIQTMVLRLLADYCLLYNNTVGLLLKRDTDSSASDVRASLQHHHHQATPGLQQAAGQEGSKAAVKSKRHSSSGGGYSGTGRPSMPGSSSAGAAGYDPPKAGVVLRHIMHVQLVDSAPEGTQSSASVASNASALLQAVCIRSGEGRRRIMSEVVSTLTAGADLITKDGGSKAAAVKADPKLPYVSQQGGPEPAKVSAYVSFMGALVQSGSSPCMSRSDPRQSSGTSMSLELLRAMREAGAVKALAQVLKLVNTDHAKAKDAINAVLKPLEVLTRPLPKQVQPVEQQELRTVQTQAAGQHRRATALAPPETQVPASAAATTAAALQAPTGARQPPTAARPPAAAAAAAVRAAPPAHGVAGRSSASGESGGSGRAAMDEDQRHQAGEEAAGPDALAAAGRFVAGGAGQARSGGQLAGGLIDHLMEQLVDIEVELEGGDLRDDGGDGDSSDPDGSDDDDGDDASDEGSHDSDEDMDEGAQQAQAELEGPGAMGGSDEGAMGDDPSLTEEEDDDSDGEGPHAELVLDDAGVAFINADAAAAANGAAGHHLADMESSGEPESDDDRDHHHHHVFDDELLPEDDMHLLPPQLDAGHHAQEDGVVDPLDDEEEEEEADEYLDDDEEHSDDDEDDARYDIDAAAEEFLNGGGRFSFDVPMPGELDDMPAALMMPGGFGRAAARRMAYRPGAAAATAGVWDDSEPGDATHDPLNGAVTVQMMLNQLGINAGSGGSVAMIGPNGRQYRMAVLAPEGTGVAAGGSAGSEAMAGAMNTALYSLSMQLMPQQHRLLALPPRVPVSDSTALLDSAGPSVPAAAPAGDAAVAGAASGLRSQASSVQALTRLLARAPEGPATPAYMRDGIRARMTAQRAGNNLFSVQLNPASLPTTLGTATNFLQSLELLQPGGLLGGPPGAGALADLDNTVWDEAVNQLLEALAPQGLGRARAAAGPVAPGAARAGGAAEEAGLDPRLLESQMLALLRAHGPPQQPQQQQPDQQQQQQEPQDAQRSARAVVQPQPAQAGFAAGTEAGAAAVTAAAGAGQPSGRRTLTEEVVAAAFRAAMHEDQPVAAEAEPAQEQPQQQQQAQAAAELTSHPVEVPPSAPESDTDGDAGGSTQGDQLAPMDTEDAPQQPAAATTCGQPAAAAAEGTAAAAQGGDAAAMDVEGSGEVLHEALRQAAEAASVDLAFLEALPDELRVEVLSARGVELRLPAEHTPTQLTAAHAEQAPGTATPPPAETAAVEASTPAPDAPATAATPAAEAAEAVPATTALAVAQAAPAEEEEPSIDPEFLAALPDDIRQEVLAQQAADRRARAAQRAAQQRQQEMGLADLLAAMDDDARADALGQLNDSDLAQLTPAMRAQAQALRERVARQQQALQQQQAAVAAQRQQQHDFMLRHVQLGTGGLGGLVPGSNRLLIPLGADGLPLGGRNRLGPLTAALGGRGPRGAAGRAELLDAADQATDEPEGLPLLDEADLAVLIHLLRASLPISKVHLQKLLLNLVGHSTTREQLLKMLLGELRSLPGASSASTSAAGTDAEDSSSQLGASMDMSDDVSGQSSQQGLAAALDMLGSAVVSPVSRSGSVALADSSNAASSPSGKPAVVSRRVVDMLAYLSRHSQQVSVQMLQLQVPGPDQTGIDKGKLPAAVGSAASAPRALEVLLAMLSAPLCQRSISLLEQLALLLEVVLSVVQRYEADLAALAAMKEARRKQQEQDNKKKQEQQQQQGGDASAAAQAGLPQQQQPPGGSIDQAPGSTPFPPVGQQPQPSDKQQQPQQPPLSQLTRTLVSIPPDLLQQLPSLLARETLSESAYISIAKVIKLIVESALVHLPLMLAVLVDGVAGVANALLGLLDTAADKGIDADAQLAPAIGTKSGVVLRMLYALQGFQSEVKERLRLQEQQQQQGKPAEAATSHDDQAPEAAAGESSQSAAVASSSAAGSSAAAGSSSSLDPVTESAEVDKAVVSVASRTAPLWKSLSGCILRVEDNLRAVLPQHSHAAGESAGHAAARLLPPGAQQVLPLVEAFFVLCALQGAIPAAPGPAKDLLTAPSADVNQLGPSPTAAAGSGSSSIGRAATPLPSASGAQLKRGASVALDAADTSLPFLRFAERHRRLLNAYIRRNTSLMESSLAPLLRVPRLIDFDNKRGYFKSKIRAQDDRTYAGGLRLAVKRSTVFEDSFNKLRSRTPAEMRGKLSVSFIGEEGIDAGGVSREWYQVMAREIFNPNLALFVSVPEGGTTFQPNPNSVVQSDTGVSHLEFFKFVGRLVGKALYDGQLMDAYFTRSFYKHMLGQQLTYEDIEAVDPEYYKNLKWMLENDITDVLDLTFTAESDFFGKTEIVELVPGGREVKVTEANKHEYVNLIARHRMTTSIKAQIQAFLEGFWQLVPRELIAIFNDHELELLISGLPDIDVADLRANSEYTGYSAASPVIQWFWQVVADMEKQDLALMLQFVTGTSKVPLGGFRALQGISGPQRFQIHKSYGTDRLPSAHTCFNQLDLPEYESKEQLAERLAMAIHEGHEGFGFG